MLKVGLTGGIGSGKTTVAGIFTLLGIPVYIADLKAHELMSSNEHVHNGVITLFGSGAFDSEGMPNRKFIAAEVFGDAVLLSKLNAIVHPVVYQDFIKWCSDYASHPYVIQEAAVLFESGGAELMDENILVWAPTELRVERVMNRDRVPEADVIARMQHQWDDKRKALSAQFILFNDQIHSLIRQVLEIDSVLRFINAEKAVAPVS